MTQETLTWLSQKAPRFATLSVEDQEHFSDFLLLWSFFEGTKLGADANVRAIRRYVSDLDNDGKLRALDTDNYLAYLRNRYYEAGEFTQFYHDLYLDRSHPFANEVEDTIQGKATSKAVMITGCLVIILRLRNNLFHGEKWSYGLEGDEANFLRANRFLKELMSLE